MNVRIPSELKQYAHENQYPYVLVETDKGDTILFAEKAETHMALFLKLTGEFGWDNIHQLGGGYIRIEESQIVVFGYSQHFGGANKQRVAQMIRESQPKMQVVVEE